MVGQIVISLHAHLFKGISCHTGSVLAEESAISDTRSYQSKLGQSRFEATTWLTSGDCEQKMAKRQFFQKLCWAERAWLWIISYWKWDREKGADGRSWCDLWDPAPRKTLAVADEEKTRPPFSSLPSSVSSSFPHFCCSSPHRFQLSLVTSFSPILTKWGSLMLKQTPRPLSALPPVVTTPLQPS